MDTSDTMAAEAAMIEETEDLRQAAEQSQRENVLVELTLDNIIKWVSSSWQDVIGSDPKEVVGSSISKVLVGDQQVFSKATDIILADDAHSLQVRFNVAMGDSSKYDEEDSEGVFKLDDKLPEALEMEGQGILVRDDHSGNPTHTMWVFKPYTGPHQTPAVDFDDVALVEALGVGAQNLDRYLQTIAEGGPDDPANHPPPLPVLCHICDRQIQPWFFERHSELCFVTHEAESMVNECQDNLRDHRQILDEFTNMFENALHRKDWEFCSEYRGVTIIQPIKQPQTPLARSTGQHSSSHHTFPGSPFRRRTDPFKQQSLRILSLLEDLCNTALEISRPAIKDDDQHIPIEEMRLQSPTSESRMVQVIEWQPPTNVEDEGLALLCQDTLALAQAKVDAVNRLRNVIIYAERIRQEINVKVEDMIQAVIEKSRMTPVDESTSEEEYEGEDDQPSGLSSLEPTPEVEEEVHTPDIHTPLDEIQEPQYSQVMAVKSIAATRRIASNFTDESSDSLSPRQSPTPRTFSPFKPSRISSNVDEGNESDASLKSHRSSHSQKDRFDLPDAIELGPRLGRKASLYGSPRRQSSPARRQISPSRHFSPSPLKPHPHRLSIAETSPLGSPVFLNHDAAQADWSRNHLRHVSSHSDQMRQVPLSPRMPSVSAAKPAPPSIKDFDVIKPISKGAFGSVYLTRKKSTGDYYAIKVLKKADMIVKNQVTNVRAERAILMAQGESPFVAKLFFTFQSKDYLYLVMEYLNGGDCAALIKNMRGLPESWAKKYIAEVVLGVEYLHEHGIVHRDLKPDNLLIDSRGHLKMTDFGLSRMGLIGRQRRANDEGNLDPIDPVHQGRFIGRPASRGSSRSTSYDLHSSPVSTPVITPETPWNMPSYFNLPPTSSGIFDNVRRTSGRSYDGADEGLTSAMSHLSLSDSKQHSRTASDDEDASSDSLSAVSGLGLQHLNTSNTELNKSRVIKRHSQSRGSATSMGPPAMALFDPNDTSRKFVGTPDYLAPETIDGTGQDGMVDWWAVGCILFEFVYGYPPFHDETPEKVFENILARRIDWPDEGLLEEPVSEEVKDIMDKLMCLDQTKRLGAAGAQEVKNHPFFSDVNWDTLFEDDTPFVPQTEHPEDTDYFDSRGLTGTLHDFPEEDTIEDSTLRTPEATEKEKEKADQLAVLRAKTDAAMLKRGGLLPLSIPPHVREQSRRRDRRSSEPPNEIDFGSFVFKNLPVLEKANKDTIERLRAENATLGSPSSPASSSLPSASSLKIRQKSISSGKGLSSPSASSSGSGSFFSFNSPPTGFTGIPAPTPPLSRSSALPSSYGSDQYPVNPLPPLTFPSKFRKPSVLLPSAMREDGSETSGSRRGSRSVESSNSALNSPVQSEYGLVKQRSAEPLTSDSHHVRRNTMPPRMRAASVSSSGIRPLIPEGWKIPSRRRSQVFEVSPSSSDTEEAKGNALLRVHQRRAYTRRQSIMNLNVGPRYRPLDVLGILPNSTRLMIVCEDNPVSRRVMEAIVSKLGCRVISHADGAEAVRCAMGDVKFDIIFTDIRLPKRDNVARMIRGTENINSNTPIVAVTSYSLESVGDNLFDAVIEKPVSPARLSNEIEQLCYWRPPPPSRRSSIRMSREPSTPASKEKTEGAPSTV